MAIVADMNISIFIIRIMSELALRLLVLGRRGYVDALSLIIIFVHRLRHHVVLSGLYVVEGDIDFFLFILFSMPLPQQRFFIFYLYGIQWGYVY